MTRRLSLMLLVTGLSAITAVSACGNASSSPASSSSSGASATPVVTATPAPTPTPSAAPLDVATCPPASVVNAALGTTLPAPSTVLAKDLAAALPSGAGSIGCEYQTTTQLALVILMNNMPASDFTPLQQAVATALGAGSVTFTAVPGLGDEADSYTYASPQYGAAVGVDAQQGTNRVTMYVAGGSPTLSAAESLVKQLLS